MLAQFSIYPTQAEHMNKAIASVIETLDNTGLVYKLGPLSTAVQGSWDEIMAAIHRCHDVVARDQDRVITTIVINDRKDQPHDLPGIVKAVEQQLGRQVPSTNMDPMC